MTSRTTASFWRLYNVLPADVQTLAAKNFALFQNDPIHPSLQFKEVNGLWSARIGVGYRVLGIEENGELFWFWIGPHAEYDKILARR